MKTFKTTLIGLLFSITLVAQIKKETELETLGGYEHNYFKSPEEVHQDGIIFKESDLIKSSIFQDFMLDYDYSKKWNENRLRFSISPYSRLFYENLEDSYWSLLASAKYDYNFSNNIELLAETSIKRMNRRGLDGDQDVLINPLGYTNLGAKAGMEFRPVKNNKTEVILFYNFRNFDKYGIRDLQYNERGLKIETAQKRRINSLVHQYGLSLSSKKRFYDTYNSSKNIANGERIWGYFKATAFYEYPINKALELEPSFVYYVRSDKKDNRSGFNQFGPVIKLKFKHGKTKIRSGIKYLTRNYKSIEARDNNGLIGEKIQYNYFDVSFNASHQLTDNLTILATLYSRIRSTNYTDVDARSFRGYTHQYASIGISWKF